MPLLAAAPARFLPLDWVVFIGYLLIIFLVGAAFARRQTSTNEFFKAGQRMSWWIVGFSVIASLFSGISFISHPGRVYRFDTAIMGYAIATVIATPVLIYVLLPFYRRLDVTTAYEYLEKRFDLNVRLLASSLFLLKRLFWMALVALAPSLALTTFTGIDVVYCILIIGVVATIYTMLGGMSAVLWTDATQFVVLMVGQLVIIFFVAWNLDGGFGEIISIAAADGKLWPSMEFSFGQLTFWAALVGGVTLALSDLGADQVTVQRLMTTPDERTARKALWFNMIFKIPSMAILLGMGLALWAFYQANPEPFAVVENADKMVPHFIVTQLPAGVSGFVIAAIFAAAMSSFDSGLNCMVTAFSVDWHKRLGGGRAGDRYYLWWAKLLTLVLGLSVTLLAIVVYEGGVKSIVDASNTYLGYFGGALLGIFLLGVFTSRAKALPTVLGAVVSVVVVVGLMERQASIEEGETETVNAHVVEAVQQIGAGWPDDAPAPAALSPAGLSQADLEQAAPTAMTPLGVVWGDVEAATSAGRFLEAKLTVETASERLGEIESDLADQRDVSLWQQRLAAASTLFESQRLRQQAKLVPARSELDKAREQLEALDLTAASETLAPVETHITKVIDRGGHVFIDPYMSSLISCLLTLLIGYLGSFFGPQLSYETVKEFTLARR